VCSRLGLRCPEYTVRATEARRYEHSRGGSRDQALTASENARWSKHSRMRIVQLAEASQPSRQFLAKLSMTLRTPLNAIIGYSEMRQEEKPGRRRKTRKVP